MPLSASDWDLVNFLCGVLVRDVKPTFQDTACQAAAEVGATFPATAAVEGPVLNLGCVFPYLREEHLTLAELLSMPRESIDALCKRHHFTVQQWCALLQALPSVKSSSTLEPCPPPPSIRTQKAAVFARSLTGGGSTTDSPNCTFDVACRECDVRHFIRVTRQEERATSSIASLSRSVPQESLQPAHACRTGYVDEREKIDSLVASAHDATPVWTLTSAVAVSAVRRRYGIASPDEHIATAQFISMLKHEESDHVQVASALCWWQSCMALSAKSCTKTGPTLTQLLGNIEPGIANGTRYVLRHYAPQSGWFATLLEAQERQSPTSSVRDAAFLKLFPLCPNPTVVSYEDVVHCWKRDPSLALPFLAFFVIHAPIASFVAVTKTSRRSTKGKKKVKGKEK